MRMREKGRQEKKDDRRGAAGRMVVDSTERKKQWGK
jgi:hypothetical protein